MWLRLLAVFISGSVFGQEYEQRDIFVEPKPWGPFVFESKVPQDCPVDMSKDFVGIEFTGRNINYTNADTWYPSWASDGNMYSPFTDGRGNGIWRLGRSYGNNANTGYAKIQGDDPLNLKITPLGAYPNSTQPYGGRYPSASLVYDGVWYYGTYCLDPLEGYNWGILGPFVGFRISKDYGKTWEDTTHTPANSLFKESGKDGNVVKIGAPHFVDFGKNMEYSPDGKAYLVAHGALKEDTNPRPANNSWISGDQIYLLRVKPSPENINDMSKYEYFAGYDVDNQAIWSNNFEDIKPIFDWNNSCGCVTITYNNALKKYIMSITDGWPTVKYMDTYLLESDNIHGPWKMITYMQRFGEQAYFVNIPSKFISKEGNKAWLAYSGNFMRFSDLGTNPKGGSYAFILQEFKLLTPNELENYPYKANEQALKKRIAKWEEANPLKSSKNLALKATVRASTLDDDDFTDEKHKIESINDGDVDTEWRSKITNRHHYGLTWIRLTWDKPQSISKIWLFDLKNEMEQVVRGAIKMSDGTIMTFDELPNEEYRAKEITFPTKKVEWIEFTSVEVANKKIGFSEIAVF